MVYLYHGTSAESATKILQHGFETINPTWLASFHDQVYLHTEKTEDYTGVTEACKSAIITAAIQNSAADYIVVLQLGFSEEDYKTYVNDDGSIEYPGGTKEIPQDVLNTLIQQGRVRLAAAKVSCYEPLFRTLYLCGCSDNPYLNLSDEQKFSLGLLVRQFPVLEDVFEHILPMSTDDFASLTPFTVPDTTQEYEQSTHCFV